MKNNFLNLKTRVRFFKDSGLLKTKPFVAGTDMVYLVLDEVNSTIRAFNLANKEVALEMHGNKKYSFLKRRAKEVMRNLGVVFYDETRITNDLDKNQE